MIVIEEYMYRCVLSNAKIQMMIIDLPRIDYGKKKKTVHGVVYSRKAMDECIEANARIEREYKARMAKKEVNLTDLINNSSNGE